MPLIPINYSGYVQSHGLTLRFFFLCLMLTLALGSTPAVAQAVNTQLDIPPATSHTEAWLVTYSPGEIYWQRFGHNAIWIRDSENDIDHTFSFGFFDFNQEKFFQRFVQGRMLYFALAQPSLKEFEQYLNENRSVSARKLQLSADAFRILETHLLNHIKPENRNYLYDYYLDNCSTRVRDAIDLALGGALKNRFSSIVAEQNFREHTRRSTSLDFSYSLALEAALGSPVDRSISRWDEMFLPAVVDEVLADLEVDGVAIAGEEKVIFRSTAVLPPESAPDLWPRYLLVSILFVAFFIVLGRLAGSVMAMGSVLTWLTISASGGMVLAGLWGFTDHTVAGPNTNLLLLNPLFVLGLWPRLRKFSAQLLLGGLGLVAIEALVPGGQYNLDMLAFFAPINVCCAIYLWRNPD
ncbi:MAG: hypothetical protein ACI9CB_000321 [Rhodothermales bacterium]|jgi:hypothetical protein